MGCKNIGPQKPKLCVGDLNTLISIKSKALRFPVDGTYDASPAFTEVLSAWSSVEVVSPYKQWNSTGLLEFKPTHKFLIRYNASVTSAMIIEYDGTYFDIIHIEDPNMNKRYLILYTVLIGNTSAAASSIGDVP